MSEPSQRILLLTNDDFAPDAALSADRASDPTHESRVDVAKVAREVEAALRRRGAAVERMEVTGADVDRVLEVIAERPPSLVFNLCESLLRDSRNEIVFPALLDLLHVPYTGSGPLALGLALDKPTAKRLLASHGIPTPLGRVVFGLHELDCLAELRDFPVFCKLAREDASVGITHENVCLDGEQARRRAAALLAEFGQPVLVERYVDGREIYVSVLGGEPPSVLGRHEIDFTRMPPERPRIVSYEGKWVPSSLEYLGTQPIPCAPLDVDVAERLDRVAIESFRALGLRDYGRVDVRLGADGTPYVIDVNPNCDLSTDAGFARAARMAGVGYEELIGRICELAWARAERAGWIARRAPRQSRSEDGATQRQAGGSPGAQGAPREGWSVHAGGDRVRARAHRPRARAR